MGDKWKAILGTVAPKIAGSLGGPLASNAISIVSSLLLDRPDGSEEEVAKAIEQASPDQLLALKKADLDFEAKMAKIHADDRADARLLARTKGMLPQIILSGVYVLGFFGVMLALLSGMISIAPTLDDILKMLIGALTVGLTNVMQFWFGSSAGSKSK